jgi:drug/metabolite transporter (DMT)-like permease
MALHEIGLSQARGFRLKLILALAAVYVVWGSTYLAIRYAVETLPPFSMAGVRFLVAGGLLYGWARFRGTPRPAPVHWRSAAVVGGLLLLGGNGIVVWAEQFVDSGLTALLVSTTPFWMVLLHWLFQGGVRPGPRLIAGLVLGLVGVAMLARPGSGQVAPFAAVLLVLASLSWASGSLYSRRAPLPSSPLLGTGMEMISGGALLLGAGLIAGEPARFDPAAVTAASLASFLYLIFIGSLVGFTAYIWLLKAAPPSLASTYAYVNPMVAVFLGWAFAGEPVTSGTLLSAAVIVAGVALITTASARSKAAEAAAEKAAEERAPGGAAGVLERCREEPEPALAER